MYDDPDLFDALLPVTVEQRDFYVGQRRVRRSRAREGVRRPRCTVRERERGAIRRAREDRLVQQARDNGEDLSRDEIERLLREDPRRLENAGLNDALGSSFEIASAQSPEEILIALYYMGGFDGNGSAAIQALLDFTMETARARHGDRAFPSDHADSDLPGRSVVPDCD